MQNYTSCAFLLNDSDYRDAGRKNDRGSEPWVEAQQSPLHASFARLKSRASQEHGSGVQREVRLMKTEEPKTPTAEFYSTVRQVMHLAYSDRIQSHPK